VDRLVNPTKPVKNYRTSITGLSAEDLDGITCSLADVQVCHICCSS
jgi:RNA exonuclease 1